MRIPQLIQNNHDVEVPYRINGKMLFLLLNSVLVPGGGRRKLERRHLEGHLIFTLKNLNVMLFT
jgi:hypothetical protein